MLDVCLMELNESTFKKNTIFNTIYTKRMNIKHAIYRILR